MLLLGVVTAVLACLIPVVSATRHSIVTYKQEMVRKSRSPFWQRYYLDFLLAGLVYIGYRSLQRQGRLFWLQPPKIWQIGADSGSRLICDPGAFLGSCGFACVEECIRG
jgi:hypothetical protein